MIGPMLIRGATEWPSNLTHARLRRARLAGAVLYGARLAHAELEECDLAGAMLDGADLTGTILAPPPPEQAGE
jgi:uncharacterized protein YjbI with pentapeptide repeats